LWRVPLYVAPGLPRPTNNQVPSRATRGWLEGPPLRLGRRIHLGRRSCTHCRTLMPSAFKPLAPHTQQIAATPSRGFIDRPLRWNGACHGRERWRVAALGRGRPTAFSIQHLQHLRRSALSPCQSVTFSSQNPKDMSGPQVLQATYLRVGTPTVVSRGSRVAAIAHRRCERRTVWLRTSHSFPLFLRAVCVARRQACEGSNGCVEAG
jgi:hypothetical protein